MQPLIQFLTKITKYRFDYCILFCQNFRSFKILNYFEEKSLKKYIVKVTDLH